MESKGQKTLFSEQPQLCLGKRAERWGRAAWSLPPENPVKPDVVACVWGGGAQACLLACLLTCPLSNRGIPRSSAQLPQVAPGTGARAAAGEKNPELSPIPK